MKINFQKIPRWLQIVIVAVVIIAAVILVLKFGGWFDKVAAIYVAQGDAALSERDYSQAMERYAYALSLQHLDGNVAYEAYLKRGQILLAKRNYEQALEELDKATHLRKRRPEAYFLLGQAEQAVFDYDNAVLTLEKAVKYDSDKPEYLVELAKAIFRQGQEVSRADDLLQQAINLDSELQAAYFYRALVVMEDNPEEARQLIAQALDLSGNLTYQVQSAHERILDYQQRIAERSDEEESQSYRKVLTGWTYANVNEAAAAERMADEALEITPDYRDAWQLKGWAQIERGDYTGAITSLTEAYNIDSTSGQTQYLFALAESGLGKTDAALESFAKALTLGYDQRRLRLDYADLLLTSGDKSGAEKQIRAAYKQNRQDTEVVRDLIWFLGAEQVGNDEEIVAIAVRLNKELDNAESESLLALAYLLSGDDEKAADLSDSIIAREPSQALAYYVRGRARGDGADLVKAVDVDFEGTIGAWASAELTQTD